MSAPVVSGQFFRKGPCAVCGKACERTKTFVGDTYESMVARGNAWTAPLTHKRCEWRIGERS